MNIIIKIEMISDCRQERISFWKSSMNLHDGCEINFFLPFYVQGVILRALLYLTNGFYEGFSLEETKDEGNKIVSES